MATSREKTRERCPAGGSMPAAATLPCSCPGAPLASSSKPDAGTGFPSLDLPTGICFLTYLLSCTDPRACVLGALIAFLYSPPASPKSLSHRVAPKGDLLPQPCSLQWEPQHLAQTEPSTWHAAGTATVSPLPGAWIGPKEPPGSWCTNRAWCCPLRLTAAQAWDMQQLPTRHAARCFAKAAA